MSKLNDFVDRILVISLPHRSDRRSRIDYQFKHQGITNYEYIEAVNGREAVYDNIYDGILSTNLGKKSRGALGCILSHLKCLNLARFRGYKFIAIFEDDALLHNDFNILLDIILNSVPEYWELLYLGYKMSKAKSKIIEEYNSNWFYYINGVIGSHAWIVNSSCYDILIDEYLALSYPVDIVIKHTDILTYISKNNLVITSLDSDIEQTCYNSTQNKWSWKFQNYFNDKMINLVEINNFSGLRITDVPSHIKVNDVYNKNESITSLKNVQLNSLLIIDLTNDDNIVNKLIKTEKYLRKQDVKKYKQNVKKLKIKLLKIKLLKKHKNKIRMEIKNEKNNSKNNRKNNRKNNNIKLLEHPIKPIQTIKPETQKTELECTSKNVIGKNNVRLFYIFYISDLNQTRNKFLTLLGSDCRYIFVTDSDELGKIDFINKLDKHKVLNLSNIFEPLLEQLFKKGYSLSLDTLP